MLESNDDTPSFLKVPALEEAFIVPTKTTKRGYVLVWYQIMD